MEQKIGIHQLLDLSAGDRVFNSPGSSVHTLGEIAISKLLSPSHAANSVSLYSDYTTWMKEQGIDHSGFNGFQSNRFGRIAEIAKQFLNMRENILKFFDAVVDENANKLVLAVSTYVQSEWFLTCSRVYEKVGDAAIFPFMDLLGIDEAKKNKRADRNWEGIRQFFTDKLTELEVIRDECNKNDQGETKLLGAVVEEVIISLRRQLSATSFFNSVPGCQSKYEEQPDLEKLKKAPLTNLGCEGQFAKFDNRVKVGGGSSSVETLSKKNIVSTNSLLTDDSFTFLSESERREQWKWARNSDETEEARIKHKAFLSNVQAASELSLRKKEDLKRKRNLRMIKLLEVCKEHGGPITPQNIDKLNALNSKQLSDEVSYLKLTISPNMRMKRRVPVIGDPKRKFRYDPLSDEELRSSIRNAIKPEADVKSDVNQLLLSVLK